MQRALSSSKPALIEIRIDPEAITPDATMTQIRETARGNGGVGARCAPLECRCAPHLLLTAIPMPNYTRVRFRRDLLFWLRMIGIMVDRPTGVPGSGWSSN